MSATMMKWLLAVKIVCVYTRFFFYKEVVYKKVLLENQDFPIQIKKVSR